MQSFKNYVIIYPLHFTPVAIANHYKSHKPFLNRTFFFHFQRISREVYTFLIVGHLEGRPCAFAPVCVCVCLSVLFVGLPSHCFHFNRFTISFTLLFPLCAWGRFLKINYFTSINHFNHFIWFHLLCAWEILKSNMCRFQKIVVVDLVKGEGCVPILVNHCSTWLEICSSVSHQDHGVPPLSQQNQLND